MYANGSLLFQLDQWRIFLTRVELLKLSNNPLELFKFSSFEFQLLIIARFPRKETFKLAAPCSPFPDILNQPTHFISNQSTDS